MKSALAASIACVALLAATPANTATVRWTTAHAQAALKTFRFAFAGATVYQVTCHPFGRGARVAGQLRYPLFDCTVFGQKAGHGAQIAANVRIQPLTATRYRRVSCQTASMPVGETVCP